MAQSWEPFSFDDLSSLIAEEVSVLDSKQAALWRMISIPPMKWIQHPWGDDGGGFWVAAVMGMNCLYFNDIEEGWNWSPWTVFGTINQYRCNQDELVHVLSTLVSALETPPDGEGTQQAPSDPGRGHFGPPEQHPLYKVESDK